MNKNYLKYSPFYLFLVTLPVAFFMTYASDEIFKVNKFEGDFVKAAANYDLLDGTAVSQKQGLGNRVFAVMIDNHPDARPQSGLSSAKIVYEAPVEGSITRYMAIYENNQNVYYVGPVRSARPYFIDWAQEYGDPLYAHSGGSPKALAILQDRNIFDGDEFAWGKYYWRSMEKEAPHNLYTSVKNLGEMVSERNRSAGDLNEKISWNYTKLIGTAAAKPIKEIIISYDKNYVVSWKFDAKKKDYVRYINGAKDLDKDGSEIRARNIVVQKTTIKTLDGEGRKEIKTVGSGDALVYKKGYSYNSTWKKASLTGRTRFYLKNGNAVMFVPGQTWVEVVSVTTAVKTVK